ncbi:CPBP family intramembrane metalloprotease [Candidatus Parcubacteria bacterium]|nr:MAG: CPBP family intramembrane metalloprotease [Candidatus Parcubacteria bacterium]
MSLVLRPKQILLAVLVIFLIIAKVLPIYHVQLDGPKTYLDVDRALALIALVTAYLWGKTIVEVTRTVLLFIISGVAAAGVACLIPSLENQCLRILIMFFMTALVEEILFRGVVAELMLRRFGVIVAGGLSSLFFALVHPGSYVFPVYGFLVFLTGILCFVFYYSFKREYGYIYGILAASVAHIAVIMLGIWIGIL